MRNHNHRMALSTRMANRYSNHRLPAGYMPPVQPCHNVGHGNAQDTFKFTATTADAIIIMFTRLKNDTRPNAGLNVTKGTRAIFRGDNVGESFMGKPMVLAQHQTGLVAGDEVTVGLQFPGEFMPGYSMCYVLGVDRKALPDTPIQSLYASASALPVTQANSTMHFPGNAQSYEAFWVEANTSHQRGPLSAYSTTSSEVTLRAIVCSGEAIDDPSLNPPEVTGGWYNAHFWRKNAGISSGFARVDWPTALRAEHPAGRGTAQALLKPGATFTGMLPVTKVS